MRINEAKRNIVLTIIGAMSVVIALPYCVFVMDNGIAIALLLVTTSTALLTTVLWRNRILTTEMQLGSVENETRRRLILLNKANALLWYYDSKALHFTTRLKDNRGVLRTTFSNKEFRDMVAKESHESLLFFRTSIAEKGSYHVRLKMTFDEGHNWHWYELCYTVTAETIRKHILTGLSIVIDDVVSKEDQMIIAQRQKNEIQTKETFIENIGEGMMIPFKAIQKCSNIVISDNGTLPIADKKRLSQIIKDNTNMLLSIINKVAQRSMAR